MTRNKLRILTTAAIPVVMYLVFSFVAWELDASRWSEGTRFLLALWTPVIMGLYVSFPGWSE